MGSWRCLSCLPHYCGWRWELGAWLVRWIRRTRFPLWSAWPPFSQPHHGAHSQSSQLLHSPFLNLWVLQGIFAGCSSYVLITTLWQVAWLWGQIHFGVRHYMRALLNPLWGFQGWSHQGACGVQRLQPQVAKEPYSGSYASRILRPAIHYGFTHQAGWGGGGIGQQVGCLMHGSVHHALPVQWLQSIQLWPLLSPFC